MRKHALLTAILLLGLVVGCNGGAVSPTPSPSPSPQPTSAQEVPTAAPSASLTASGPATCVAVPLEFEAESRIPPVTEADHVHGPADASITLIEYADFQ
jgi:hypothetical protein